MTTLIDDPRLVVERRGLGGLAQLGTRRLRQGELGPLPVIVGLIAIATIFQVQNANFLTALNLTNLLLQISPVGVISIGVVLVLLLGEIDLSVGSVSGFCAAIMTVLSVKHQVWGPAAVLAGIVTGAVIGAFVGFMRTRVQVPSFIVTLAGLTAFNGALLYTLGETGSLNLTDTFITDLENLILPVWLGWSLGVTLVAVQLIAALRARSQRRRVGLRHDPDALLTLRILAIAIPVLAIVAIMSVDRGRGAAVSGVPLGVAMFLGLVVITDAVVTQSRWGRHVYAVGGSEEAARRAGIKVNRIRMSVFVLSSTLAALGGILAASRLFAVNQSSGGSDVLLNAIAAAVIGGTSLFGGRGKIYSALLGSLVIGSIANGMDLLALTSSVKFMITGAVLLAAVSIDALSRRGRTAAGRG